MFTPAQCIAVENAFRLQARKGVGMRSRPLCQLVTDVHFFIFKLQSGVHFLNYSRNKL